MIINITEAIAEAAEFIYATLDHAAECDLENRDDFDLHCAIDADYVPHMKEIADVLHAANPYKGPHDPVKWCADNCPHCESLWVSKMELDANIQ